MYILQCILLLIATMFTTKKHDGPPTPKSAGPVAARALVEEHRNVARSVGKRPAVAAQDVKSAGFLKLEFISKVIQYAKAGVRDDLFIVGLWRVWFWSLLFSLCDILWYTSLLKNCWLSEGGYANFCKWCQIMCFEGDGDTNAAGILEFVTRLTRYGWCLTQDRGS